jgi:Xaa-Pro aminopeptidase
MIGYKYNTESEAINARKLAADYKGLPINQKDTTIYWVNYEYSELDDFYYIQYVEGLNIVLGEPSEIILTLPNMPS